MKRIYLVDSENVGDVWVPLLAASQPEDVVLVFYTQKSPHMNYENVRMLKETEKEAVFIKCFEGSNALDFQLVTELGYRLRGDADCEYVIVSNDTGFDAAVRYWAVRKQAVSRLSGKECYRQLTNKKRKDPKSEDDGSGREGSSGEGQTERTGRRYTNAPRSGRRIVTLVPGDPDTEVELVPITVEEAVRLASRPVEAGQADGSGTADAGTDHAAGAGSAGEMKPAAESGVSVQASAGTGTGAAGLESANNVEPASGAEAPGSVSAGMRSEASAPEAAGGMEPPARDTVEEQEVSEEETDAPRTGRKRSSSSRKRSGRRTKSSATTETDGAEQQTQLSADGEAAVQPAGTMSDGGADAPGQAEGPFTAEAGQTEEPGIAETDQAEGPFTAEAGQAEPEDTAPVQSPDGVKASGTAEGTGSRSENGHGTSEPDGESARQNGGKAALSDEETAGRNAATGEAVSPAAEAADRNAADDGESARQDAAEDAGASGHDIVPDMQAAAGDTESVMAEAESDAENGSDTEKTDIPAAEADPADPVGSAQAAPETAENEDGMDIREKVTRTLFCCISRENLVDFHNALVAFLGEEEGKELYQEIKGSTECAECWAESLKDSQKERFEIYCQLVFSHSEYADEAPEDFAEFLYQSNGKRKNLNSLRAALQGRYGKDKGMKYYSLFKSHIKIMNRM